MMRNIHQQILLLECLHNMRQQYRHDLHCSRRDGILGDHDPRVEIVLVDVMPKRPHLLDADGGLGVELHPDGADLAVGLGVLGGFLFTVFVLHGECGAGAEGHLRAATWWWVSQWGEGGLKVQRGRGWRTQGRPENRNIGRGNLRGRFGLRLR